MTKPKIGDTRGWNSKTGTGYRWNGTKWVQYKNNKPHGPFKGHGGITGNVDVVGGIRSRIGTGLRNLSGMPSKKEIEDARAAGDRYRSNNAKRTTTTTKKPTTTTTTKKSNGTTKKSNGTTTKKPATSTAKPKKKMHSIEKRNREIHGDKTIDALKKKHAEFKAKRKAGTHRKPTLTRAQQLRKRTGR